MQSVNYTSLKKQWENKYTKDCLENKIIARKNVEIDLQQKFYFQLATELIIYALY